METEITLPAKLQTVLDTERGRVARILALAATPVDPELLAAIASGSSSAIFESNRRRGQTQKTSAGGAAPGPATTGRHGWTEVLERSGLSKKGAA